jgi:hypothetical protein
MRGRDRFQFWLLIIALVVVVVGALLVVTIPTKLGLPGLHPSTPVAVEATP